MKHWGSSREVDLGSGLLEVEVEALQTENGSQPCVVAQTTLAQRPPSRVARHGWAPASANLPLPQLTLGNGTRTLMCASLILKSLKCLNQLRTRKQKHNISGTWCFSSCLPPLPQLTLSNQTNGEEFCTLSTEKDGVRMAHSVPNNETRSLAYPFASACMNGGLTRGPRMDFHFHCFLHHSGPLHPIKCLAMHLSLSIQSITLHGAHSGRQKLTIVDRVDAALYIVRIIVGHPHSL